MRSAWGGPPWRAGRVHRSRKEGSGRGTASGRSPWASPSKRPLQPRAALAARLHPFLLLPPDPGAPEHAEGPCRRLPPRRAADRLPPALFPHQRVFCELHRQARPERADGGGDRHRLRRPIAGCGTRRRGARDRHRHQPERRALSRRQCAAERPCRAGRAALLQSLLRPGGAAALRPDPVEPAILRGRAARCRRPGVGRGAWLPRHRKALRAGACAAEAGRTVLRSALLGLRTSACSDG